MATKVSFDPLTRIIQITEAPVNGETVLDFGKWVYSDGKHDWIANESLRKLRFPIEVTGGQLLPSGDFLDSTFFLDPSWKIRPYEMDHRLIFVGNVYSPDGSTIFVDTVGNWRVIIEQSLSSIVTKASGSGATAQEVWDYSRASITDPNSIGYWMANKLLTLKQFLSGGS